MNHRIDSEYWLIVWNKFKSGDRNAFKTIYNEFVDALYSYGARYTHDSELVKDAIQDVFIDVYTYGKSIRKPESLEFYLYKTLKRIIIRKLVEKNKISSVLEIKDSFQIEFSIEEEVFTNSEDLLLKLQTEISNLSPEKKELLFLKFNSGLTYKEISKLLDMKSDTVKKQIHRIIEQLRKKLHNSDILVLLTMFYSI